MKHILIGKNVNYAASKSSTTADTATSPELLRDGAIGFYTETGTLIPAAGTGMAAATKFFVAQGTATGCITTPILDRRSGAKVKSNRDYTAPVLQVSTVGFTGSAGSFSNGTIVQYDEALIKIIETTVGRQVFPKQTFSAALKAGATRYDIALGLVNAINNTPFQGISTSTKIVTADVKANGTTSSFVMTGTTPTLTFTNGSTLVTLGGGTPTFDGAVGEYMLFNPTATPTIINGTVYRIAAISAGVSVTLDRPFTGTTQTLTEAEGEGTRLLELGTITEAGVRLTATEAGRHFRLSVGGVIQDATITYVTPFNPGSGTFAQIAAIEKDFAANSRGYWNRIWYSDFGKATLYATSGTNYDVWNFKLFPILPDKSGMDAIVHEDIYTIVAVDTAATTVNTALDTITAAI